MRALPFFVFVVIALASCQPDSGQVNYFTGTEGVAVSFVKGVPPERVFDDSSFEVVVLAHNRGAYSLQAESKGYFRVGYDPFYVQPVITKFAPNIPYIGFAPYEDELEGPLIASFELFGKGPYFSEGQREFFNVTTLRVRKIEGQRENPKTEIFVTACYPYATNLTTTVCIDTDPYGANARTQACQAQELEFPEGQGAPVVISRIVPEMLPTSGGLLRPQFRFTIENAGGGTIMSPASKAESLCSFVGIDRTTFDTIEFEASLLDVPLTCRPASVRLQDGTAEVVCYVDTEGLQSTMFPGGGESGEDPRQKFLQQGPSFVTLLMVKIEYVYATTITHELSIERSS